MNRIFGSIIVVKPLWQNEKSSFSDSHNINIPYACPHLKQRPLVSVLHLLGSHLISTPAVVDRS